MKGYPGILRVQLRRGHKLHGLRVNWVGGGTDQDGSQVGRSDFKLGAQVKLLERMQTLQAMLNTQKARR